MKQADKKALGKNTINAIPRLDHRFICGWVEPGSTALDLGCGNGDLLALLRNEKQVKGQGLELDEAAIFQCVEKGLSVFHMDFDSGLASFPDNSFDVVVLNQSLQEIVHVEYVLDEALRVGKQVVVGFSNFANIKARVQLFYRGLTPVTNALPHLWYNTPNLHFLSILDFEQYASARGIRVLKRFYYSGGRRVRFRPNLLARNAIFAVTR